MLKSSLAGDAIANQKSGTQRVFKGKRKEGERLRRRRRENQVQLCPGQDGILAAMFQLRLPQSRVEDDRPRAVNCAVWAAILVHPKPQKSTSETP